MTAEEVAEQLLISASKVSRMETGHRGVTLRDVRDLCDLYGVTDTGLRDELKELAAEGKQPGWWAAYELNQFAQYVGLETAATEVWYYRALTIPGLLQTEGYVRALNKELISPSSPEQEAEWIEVRLKRQQRLTEPPPLRLRALLDESVLRRIVGRPDVMAEQIDRMIELADDPHADVAVQVLPFASGANPAMESTFNLLKFVQPEPPIVYVEGLSGWMYLERPEDVSRYEQVFGRLQEIALTPEESVQFMTTISSAYKRSLFAESDAVLALRPGKKLLPSRCRVGDDWPVLVLGVADANPPHR
jgi:transcriptional regulator with XRE-family HTH domain